VNRLSLKGDSSGTQRRPRRNIMVGPADEVGNGAGTPIAVGGRRSQVDVELNSAAD
jgi:hypothetical protein